MIKRTVVTIALLVSSLALSSGVDAGGWASVRIVAQTGVPIAGSPWDITLLVQQHDVTPIDADAVTATFVSEITQESVVIDAEPTGETGTYRLIVTLPTAGAWNWTVTPGPFPPFAMETLTVGDPSESAGSDQVIARAIRGSCLGNLSEIQAVKLATSQTEDGARFAVGSFTDLGELFDRAGSDSIAIIVYGSMNDEIVKACLDVQRPVDAAPAIMQIGLDEDGDPSVTLSLLPVGEAIEGTITVIQRTASPQFTVHITDTAGGAFEPAFATVPVGSNVQWVNESTIAHTVTSLDGTMHDSGMIDPGTSFTLTFDHAGTFDYACSPHPGMTGSIVVTES